tara:strand:- start:169 stop:429 length:261 start_codon:yes stop_codon:yes gene_type:complete
MSNVIEFKKVKAEKAEESDEMLEEVNRAKTLIALILGKADVSIINGSLAMQSLVNKIIVDEEWDKEKFQIAAESFVLVTEDDKELH